MENHHQAFKPKTPYNFNNIMELCCDVFGVDKNEVTRLNEKGGMSKKREFAHTRFAVMYFLKVNTILTNASIGLLFFKDGRKMANQDVNRGVKIVKTLIHPLQGDANFTECFERIESILEEQFEVFRKDKINTIKKN